MKDAESVAKEFEKRGNDHYNSIVVEAGKELVKLPESVFINSFLPYFCGEKKITEDETIIPTWIAIAGSPTKEVEIVDSQGLVLFNVPPMADTTVIDALNKNKGQRMNDIIGQYILRREVTPMLGTNYLNEVLDERITKLTTESTSFVKNEKRWQEIFIRYGKVKANPTEDKSIAIKGKLDEDEMTFD